MKAKEALEVLNGIDPETDVALYIGEHPCDCRRAVYDDSSRVPSCRVCGGYPTLPECRECADAIAWNDLICGACQATYEAEARAEAQNPPF